MTFPRIPNRFIAHEYHVLCECIAWAALTINFLPHKSSVRKLTRVWPLSLLATRTRASIALAYDLFVDMCALSALNLRYRVPSLELEFLGFCKDQYEHWRTRQNARRLRNASVILLFALFAPKVRAQVHVLPDSPTPRPFALNVGITSRYSATRSDFDAVARIGLDYRIQNTPLRVGLDYTHGTRSGENVVIFGVNLKLLDWGHY